MALWANGHRYVVGMDEVGRGCLAGPLTVVATVLPVDCELPDVRDSKLLTSWQRERAAQRVKQVALAVGVGWVSSKEVDALGVTVAQRRAGERALAQISLPYTAIILDGRDNYLGDALPVTTVIRGDQVCLAVSAAAAIAKVARDRYMTLLDGHIPGYGFARHKGYGSPTHLAALQQLGPSAYHRYSYKPVADLARVG